MARLLIEHKPEIMAVLGSEAFAAPIDWSYWRDRFEVRTSIRQYDAGIPRGTAERLAFGECIEEWCRSNPDPPDAQHCGGCGKVLGTHVLDLPDGARVHFEPEREFGCLIAYGLSRKRRAVMALALLGVLPPASWAP
jgi:hypothetical protein